MLKQKDTDKKIKFLKKYVEQKIYWSKYSIELKFLSVVV